jgi:hypothetical protein
MRKILENGKQEQCPFEPEHFRAAGITPQAAMPVLEAYQLVNQWNQRQFNPRFIYWLEA